MLMSEVNSYLCYYVAQCKSNFTLCKNTLQYDAKHVTTIGVIIVFFFICHIYPPFTRKRIVSLYFGRDICTRLGVTISELSGPPVFHIKVEAFRFSALP